ncbi:hypothetical protein BIV60_26470 [Bacillus sp. MUM 116]|nr:hypothetical protein BIV60_26470 [Bacillus sp. MUM 116]
MPILKSELPNIKMVAWQHNEFDVYIKNYYKRFVNDYLLGVKQADLVVCLTSADLIKYKNINNNSTYIYNPVTIQNTNISNLNSKNIIFVGRLILEQKGLDYLINIGKALDNGWRILVAGDGNDEKKFRHLIAKNKLQEKIILKGALKGKELSDLYSSGSIFISTSRWEGFGLVITEAMASGLPIISFKNNGPNEILKSGEYGILIKSNDVNNFTESLKELMEEKEKREYYQQKGLERIQDFKIEIILNKWSKSLRRIKD